MSNAISAMGTILRRNGVEIAEVTEIGGPAFDVDVIDVTHLRSPNFWREKIGGLKDGGELSLTINLLTGDSTHNASTGLLSAFNGTKSAPIESFTLVFPDTAATTWTLPGFVSHYEPTMAFEDKITAEVTITISGQPVLA